MNNDKFEFFLQKLDEMFVNQDQLNKTQMLKAINMSASTYARRVEQNDKYTIPVPSYKKSVKRLGKNYNCYLFDKYELAIFKTDKDKYWEIIKVKKEA